MKHQLHLDTSVSSNVQTGGMATVYKQNGNPFLSSILLGNRHKKVNTVELKSAEIPIGFYNIRYPYNTFVIKGTTYTVPPGNYTITTLLQAMSTVSGCIFTISGNFIKLEIPLYTMTSPFTFTNMNRTGATGPTSITYGTSTPGYGTSYVMTLTGGIQYWTVPYNTTYLLTVAGAAGGSTLSTPTKGNGVIIVQTTLLNQGDVIKILVGQQGTNGNNGTGTGGGGGGGTFVYNNTTSTLIAAAGGGGGAGVIGNGQYVSSMNGKNAQLFFLSGSSGYNNPSNQWRGGAGGSDGAGGGAGSDLYGGAGGGYSGNGVGSRGAFAFLNGGGGVGLGGFGGGGDTFLGAGGGAGGYSGGGGGGANKDNLGGGGGGGGGAWASFTGVYSMSATNTGTGYVIVQSPIPDAVTDFIASNPSQTTVDLTWTGSPRDTSYSIVSAPATTTWTGIADTFFQFPYLRPGTEYTFTITPVNQFGNGPPTTTDPISTIQPPPQPVSELTASNATDTTIDLTWTPSAIATSYTIESSPYSTPQTTSDTALTIAELTRNTTYRFWVTPVNSSGPGELTYSNYINTTGPLPSAVATVTATLSAPPETAILVTWDPAAGAATYSISSTPPSSTYTTDAVEQYFTNLTPDTQYTFTVTPVNLSGSGPSTTSDPLSTLLPFPHTAPAPDMTNPTLTTVDLAWTTVPGATSYVVYLWDTIQIIGSQTATATPYTYTGLEPNHIYAFSLAGVNARGEGQPSTATEPIWTVPQITGFSASNPTTTTVDLTWDVPNIMGRYDIVSDPPTTTQSYSGSPPYIFTGLTAGTIYAFIATPFVGAVDLQGDPVYSYPIVTFNLIYTGAISTIDLDPGTYNFEMGGGSGPIAFSSFYSRNSEYDPYPTNTGSSTNSGWRSYFTIQYTIDSPITIQYAVGQRANGGTWVVGGAGGTYIYDQTNSQMLFVAGGAGAGAAVSGPPDEVDPGDGSGGAAGSGGGSGAGLNSNGSDSTADGGGGGLTFGNGAYGGRGGSTGTPESGGFGGGGGGTTVVFNDLGPVHYSGGGGGYTGGTTETFVNNSDILFGTAAGTSLPGTSYMITGSTLVSYVSDQPYLADGFINITRIS